MRQKIYYLIFVLAAVFAALQCFLIWYHMNSNCFYGAMICSVGLSLCVYSLLNLYDLIYHHD